MTPQQAREKLDDLVNTRVAAATLLLHEALVAAKKDRLTWYYQGYVDGMSDDPTLKDVEGIRFLTLEQRKVKAAIRYSQSLSTTPQQKDDAQKANEQVFVANEYGDYKPTKKRSIKRKTTK